MKMKDKVLVIVLAILVNSATAAEEYERRNSSDTANYNNYNNNNYNNDNLASNAYGNNPNILGQQTTSQYTPPSQSRKRSFDTIDANANNGALFGPTAPLPVLKPDGAVFLTNNNTTKPNTPVDNNWYFSSANTPHFPSYYNKVLKGMPHFAAPYKQRDNVQEVSAIPAVQTNEIDQGPLAPAPKSLLEQAGWWEYLALLFGDSGDATALRLILHRLTKLAQLQLGEGEAARVQAATAFLADHFKPLLVSSFRDFVYDPDYTRTTAMWSSDPGFSAIIRRLVDHMDFFGAQQELERIFGPNTSVAVSFGMRQPEWLRLKLILEQIAWDLKHPNDLIGLWSSTWNLRPEQKLSILAYASNPRGSAPLDLNLPHRDLIMARINLITNGLIPNDQNLMNQESPLDQAHYKYAIQQASGNLCHSAGNNFESVNSPLVNPNTANTSVNPSNSNNLNSAATTVMAEGLKKRVGDYCELINLTPNYNQFCQTSATDSTPLASLLTAASPLFHPKIIDYVNHLERLFWAFTWTGSCMDARETLATLTEQVKVLAPREEMIRKGRIVPPGVADSIQVRLEYMQAVQQTCQSNIQLIGSADVARIFSLLNYGFLDRALAEWQRRYSSVAARLQGYPGGSILNGGEGQLLYQQARSVRITLLIYKYPKSVYVPCLSKGLLTRDPATDLTLLNLAESLDANKSSSNPAGGTRIDPLIPEMSARSLYMRALYLSGRYTESARIAREISQDNSDLLVKEFLACTQLCGSSTRNPCAAEKTYDDLLRVAGVQGKVSEDNTVVQDQYNNPSQQPQQQSQQSQQQVKPSTAKSVYSTGKVLSSRLCRLSRNTASDALSLRYGKVLTTQATFSALKRHYDNNNADDGSKLKAGRAQSVLPWFGSLPPAPVDEILSFVPTRKLNFVSQVGIDGFPTIQPVQGQGDNTQGNTDNTQGNTQGNTDYKTYNTANTANTSNPATNNRSIFVLGKEYPMDILTTSTGQGNTQPLTKLSNGIFQLSKNVKGSSQGQVNSGAGDQGNYSQDRDDQNRENRASQENRGGQEED